jgi:UPF0271 protein
MGIISNQKVTAIDGATVSMKADTVCIHGDGENALAFAQAVRKSLLNNNVEIAPVGG